MRPSTRSINMQHLFLVLLWASAGAHVVVSDFFANNPAVFRDSVAVEGATTMQNVVLNGTLDMQNHAITHAASSLPVMVSTTSAVSMDTGATVFVVNPSAGAIIVTLVNMQMFQVYHFVFDGYSTNTALLDFSTDSFTMNAPGSYLALMLINSGIKVLNQYLVASVNSSVRVRLEKPVAGLMDYPQKVAMSGDGHTLVVSSMNDNNAFGIAFVFTRSGTAWTYFQNLTAADGVQFDAFGSALAVNGDGTTILVGASSRNGYIGSAYVFTLSGTWSQQARLDPGDGAGYLAFGIVVALSDSGDRAVVGTGDTTGTGAAYIYARAGSVWTSAANLTAGGDAKTGDAFGETVDISGDGGTVIISSRDANMGSPNKTVYVFVDSGGWTRQQKIEPPSSVVATTAFGDRVAISKDGDTAAIMSLGINAAQNGAYMYTRSGGVWTFVGRLPTADIDAGDILGTNIMLGSGAGTVVMASRPNQGPPAAGHGHVYRRSGSVWYYVRTIELDAAENGWLFGTRGAISDDGFTITLTSKAMFSDGYVYVFMRV